MRGPKRAKRLYRVVLMGMGYSVLHYQDERAAVANARSRAINGISAEIYESPLIGWPDEPKHTFGNPPARKERP